MFRSLLTAWIVFVPCWATAVAQQGHDMPPTPRWPFSWIQLEDVPVEPVIEAAAVTAGDRIIITGGFDQSLQSTPAIQVRHPQRGWQPISATMQQPRARHSAVVLADGRVLVLGGMTGQVRQGLQRLDDAEIFDPRVASRGKLIPEAPGPLGINTAHLMDPRRACAVSGAAAHVLDVQQGAWIQSIDLQRNRNGHASIRLDPRRVLVVGGDPVGSDDGLVEIVHVGTHGRSIAWEARLDSPVKDAAATLLPDGRILLVGGVDPATDRPTGTCWLLDPADRSIHPGPPLPDPLLKSASPMVLVRNDRIIATDPDITSEAPAYIIRMQPRHSSAPWRVHSIGPLPGDGRHRTMLVLDDGRLWTWGGYRFVDPQEAASLQQRPGPRLDPRAHSVQVDTAEAFD